MLDSNGQPLNRRFNAKRVSDRQADQLIGLCEGVLADGVVNVEEANFLRTWLEGKSGILDSWPSNVLYARLCEFLEDGVLDADEQGELTELLMDITGIGFDQDKTSAGLPLCHPAPVIEFSERHFVLTGKFASGTRNECVQAVEALGGTAASTPSKKTNYLVIGALCSRDWIHESYGRKIEKAVELRDEGSGIAIVGEEHWLQFVSR